MQKKRGRKPKGGQVVKKSIKKNPKECNKNIILHLKVKPDNDTVIKEYNYYNTIKDIPQNTTNIIQSKLKINLLNPSVTELVKPDWLLQLSPESPVNIHVGYGLLP